MTELLQLNGVHAGYGRAVVLEDVAFAVTEGEALAVLGRNGVGKTTLMETIMGHTRLHRGELRWQHQDLRALPPHRRGPWDRERVYGLFPRLRERRRHFGNELSGGEQQMLAIGRALMLNPRLMLLDEPLEGLAPVIVNELTAAIRDMIEQKGLSVILVEQHLEIALSLTHQALVLERGRIVHRAASAELARDSHTLNRYVGIQDTHATD